MVLVKIDKKRMKTFLEEHGHKLKEYILEEISAKVKR
jgi:hypothetical protein